MQLLSYSSTGVIVIGTTKATSKNCVPMCPQACRSQMPKMERATDPVPSFNVYLAQLMNEFFCNKGRSNVFHS